jgi:cytochrome oxidase assembly protein ShyY1
MLRLALTAKWISGLLLALLLASAFAFLGQWQLGRAVGSETKKVTASDFVSLNEAAKPNQPFAFAEVSESVAKKVALHRVRAEINLYDAKPFIIADRIQLDGRVGYWLVQPAHVKLADGSLAEVFVARGWAKDLSTAKRAANLLPSLGFDLHWFGNFVGRYQPGESPLKANADGTFASLSPAQLINLVQEVKPLPSFGGFFVVDEADGSGDAQLGLETITMGVPDLGNSINWLSAFYAIEWTVFAGFAVFMWWRLLADAYVLSRQSAKPEGQR